MIEGLIASARSQGRSVLNEIESKQLVAAGGIPVVPTRHADSAPGAVALARELGFPAVVKLVSSDASHKSEVGGVRLGLADEAAVAAAFDELRDGAATASPPIRFEGVAVQPMATAAVELLLGAHRDPTFGPVVTVGLGGVLVELLEDVALRVAPLSEVDAAEMLDETRARRLLEGFRGRPAISRAPISRALTRLSALMLATPSIAEIDLNPVFAYPDAILAVDARVVLAHPDEAGAAGS